MNRIARARDQSRDQSYWVNRIGDRVTAVYILCTVACCRWLHLVFIASTAEPHLLISSLMWVDLETALLWSLSFWLPIKSLIRTRFAAADPDITASSTIPTPPSWLVIRRRHHRRLGELNRQTFTRRSTRRLTAPRAGRVVHGDNATHGVDRASRVLTTNYARYSPTASLLSR